ncbi:hypothetical protein ACOSP7_019193 [Xanthoceras sorbifolium]
MNPCADMHSTLGPARSERQQAKGNEEGEAIVALNRKFHKRLAKYSNLEILQERGIQLEELMDTVMPIVVRERSWGFFVQQLIPGSLKVDSEFYATMVPEVFENGGRVYVRGRQVHMIVKAINDYYKLDTDVDHVDWEALNPKCIAYGEGDINDKFQYLNECVGAMEAVLGTIKLGEGEMQNEDATTPHE